MPRRAFQPRGRRAIKEARLDRHRQRLADAARDVTIRAHGAEGDPGKRLPYAVLERGAAWGERQIELAALAGEVVAELSAGGLASSRIARAAALFAVEPDLHES